MAAAVNVKDALAKAQEAMLLLNKSVGNELPTGVSVTPGPSSAPAPAAATKVIEKPILVVQTADGTACATGLLFDTVPLGDETVPAPMTYYASMTMPPTPPSTKADDILKTVLGRISENRTAVQELMTKVNRLTVPQAESAVKTAYMEFLTTFLADLGKTEEIRTAITANLKWFGLTGTSKVRLVVQDALATTFGPSLNAAIRAEKEIVGAISGAQTGGARSRRVRFSRTRRVKLIPANKTRSRRH
jgi:hypothetical protein